jgi:hypothetical protein
VRIPELAPARIELHRQSQPSACASSRYLVFRDGYYGLLAVHKCGKSRREYYGDPSVRRLFVSSHSAMTFFGSTSATIAATRALPSIV